MILQQLYIRSLDKENGKVTMSVGQFKEAFHGNLHEDTLRKHLKALEGKKLVKVDLHFNGGCDRVTRRYKVDEAECRQ